jgi:adenine-specific DNA methylase
MNYPKRLIEVDLPIKKISAHARREKSLRHGHISALHIWWARRPLAACRAVLCAALWPDPADPHCPQQFRLDAARLINQFAQAAINNRNLADRCSHDTWTKWQVLNRSGGLDARQEAHWNILRFALFDFIADFADWDNSNVPEYFKTSQALTQSAHRSLGGAVGSSPLVVDPFAGGGSIPLEALRIGAEVFAGDLNPVAVLLNKAALEYIPKYGQHLADELRTYGEWIKTRAEKELAEFYPIDADGGKPVAYLWARTAKCEGPGCGVEVPLIRSLWLSNKGKKAVALELLPNRAEKRIDLSIGHDKAAGPGTVKLGSVTCPLCGYTTPVTAVRTQIRSRSGGSADARLLAVVVERPHEGKSFRLPLPYDMKAYEAAGNSLREREATGTVGLSLLPDEPTPPDGTGSVGGGYRTRKYGIVSYRGFFSLRQQLEHTVIGSLIREAFGRLQQLEPDREFAKAVLTFLALAADKQADRDSAFCRWISQNQAVGYTFGRQAIPMLWDFVESPAIHSSGGWTTIIEDIAQTIEVQEKALCGRSPAQIQEISATQSPLPDESAACVFTDPPYYDAVPYAELSDFFFVWLKRSLAGTGLLEIQRELTPKVNECVVNLQEGKDRQYFEATMTLAMAEANRITSSSGIAIVVFAHKSTAGWEAQIQAMISSGWVITGSWPIDTERPGRMRAFESAALASSVHLVCRPRRSFGGPVPDGQIGDWRDVLAELPKRIHEWMPRLQQEGVVGADAIFACLGPALEIFSRHSRVEKASGELVTLREYLEYVWGAVSREALSMIFKDADTTGFEEDARLTAMWLWTLSSGPSNGDEAGPDENEGTAQDSDEKQANAGKLSGFMLEYDAARKIAQGLGVHLEHLTNLVEAKGETARLLPVAERMKALFGKEGTESPAAKRKKSAQLSLPGLLEELEQEGSGWTLQNAAKPGTTTLDRLHQAMILFAAGRGEGLRRFLVDDGAGKDQRFWRLAQSLCALYPTGTDERRWAEGVLARKKGLGL